VFALAACAGSLAVGAGLFLATRITGQLPVAGLAGIAVLVLALEASRVPAVGSSWRIPRQWAAGRPVLAAAMFGGLLGTGVATALSSAALYLIWAWAVSSASFSAVWAPFVAFGAARAIPVSVTRSVSRNAKVDIVMASDYVASWLRWVGPAEIAVVAVVVGALLMR
jgi:hypothetical protein